MIRQTSALLYLFIFLLSSCQSDEKIYVEPNIEEAILIWSQFHEKNLKNSRTSSSLNAIPLWDKYSFHNTRFGQRYISVPLKYNNDRYIGNRDSKIKLNLASYLLYVPNENKGELYFVEVFKKTTTSGIVQVFDLNHDFVKGYKFDNSQFVPISIVKSESNSRSENCYWIDYYTCTVRDQGPDDCDLDYSILHCDFSEPEIPIFEGPGGGGEGPELTEPVDCENDDPTPDNSTIYYMDENGNCIRICASGYMVGENGECVEGWEPCDNDPLGIMEISDYNSGKNANRYGCVRENVNYTCDNEQGLRMHDGIDLKAEIGTRVHSVNSGIVVDVRHTNESDGYGHNIIIQSGSYYFMYADLNSKPSLSVGTTVSAGQIIGYSGDSDTAGEPHLHFEVRNGTNGFYTSSSVNPENFLGTNFDDNGNKLRNVNCR